jgi:hypothetical protein
MTGQIRGFVFAIAALTLIVVGAVAYRTYREALPRLSVAVVEQLSDRVLARPPNDRPTPEIERLMGDLAGTHRVTDATLRLGMNGNTRPLRAREIAALLDIVKQLTVFESPKDAMCVLLPPFHDELTLRTADSGLAIQIEVSANRALIRDRLSWQTYVVPEKFIGTLTALMVAASPDSKPPP